jgi:hypothetical protein
MNELIPGQSANVEARGRGRRGSRLAGTLSMLLVLAAGGAGSARAQDDPSKESCAEAYESAQESRASGRLRETQRRLAHCAQSACPSFVKSDCARWLEEVERELPSVMVSAPGLSHDERGNATLKLDGEVVNEALNGSAVALDPGRHQLALERPGHEPVLRTIIAQQGVQNRAVAIGQETPDPGGDSGLRPLAYAAWGAGAIGFGMFGVLCPRYRKPQDEMDARLV